MAAQAVVRGDLVYNDTFFAQVDESKRHPRASVAELKSLLRPEASPPAKDQVGHWYQAQLLHYGLSQSKDKNTAKVRLLQAINAGTLAVPYHVSKLEKDMKKEFVAAATKAKAAEKAPAAPAKGKKRTHEEATTTNITVTVGGVTIHVDQQTAGSITAAAAAADPPAANKRAKTIKDGDAATSKKAKGDTTKANKGPDTAPKTKPKDTQADKPASKKSTDGDTKDKKSTAKKPADKSTTSSATESQDKPAKPKAAPKIKEDATASKSKAEPKTKKPTAETTTEQTPVRKKQTARRGAFSAMPSSRAASSDPSETRHHTPSHWDDLRHAQPAIKPEPDRDVNGTYTLYLRSHSPASVPEVNGPPRIPIHHDAYTNKLWGHFTIGSKAGILRADDFYLDANTSPVFRFGWRMRDMVSGQMRFGRGCDGIAGLGIHGLGKGTFYRLFDGLDVDFGVSAVTRDTQMDWPEWMDEWERFVKETYGDWLQRLLVFLFATSTYFLVRTDMLILSARHNMCWFSTYPQDPARFTKRACHMWEAAPVTVRFFRPKRADGQRTLEINAVS